MSGGPFLGGHFGELERRLFKKEGGLITFGHNKLMCVTTLFYTGGTYRIGKSV